MLKEVALCKDKLKETIYNLVNPYKEVQQFSLDERVISRKILWRQIYSKISDRVLTLVVVTL